MHCPISYSNHLVRALLCFGLLFASENALAQADPGKFRFQLQEPAEDAGSAAVRDAFNRPCLESVGVASAHVVNPDLIDHLVKLENRCSRMLKLKICYFTDDRCKTLNLGAYMKEEVFLGAMMKVTRFKFYIFQK